jgi:pimeloyl-ACP methyl ester carboxylesterase
MATFVLVHGAWHGAWCWARLIPELEERGHRTIAMDLPCDDPEATFTTYADVVLDAFTDTHDVVLVGHSLAGFTVPLVAARRPVRRVVYLCALVGVPGRSFLDQMASEQDMLHAEYTAGLEPDAQGRRVWVDEGIARESLFGDCDEADVRDALARLRPQALAPYRERCPLNFPPATPSTYVVCTDDRLVRPAWSRRVAAERLGADVLELPGSHSPFLSRPAELAGLLHRLA